MLPCGWTYSFYGEQRDEKFRRFIESSNDWQHDYRTIEYNPQGRNALSCKTNEIYWKSLIKNYDYLFLINDTSFAALDRVSQSRFEGYDAVGHLLQKPNSETIWLDDSAIMLSRKAVQRIVQDGALNTPRPDADVATSEILLRHGFKLAHDPRYGWRRDLCLDPLPQNSMLTNRAHTVTAQHFLWQEYNTPR